MFEYFRSFFASLSLTQVNGQVLSSYLSEVRGLVMNFKDYSLVNFAVNLSSLLGSNNSFRLSGLNSLTNSKVESLANNCAPSLNESIYGMNIYTFISSVMTSITLSNVQIIDFTSLSLNLGGFINKLSLFATL